MKIIQSKSSLQIVDDRLSELEVLIDQLENKDLRPCAGCMRHCSCSNSITCTCDCTFNCVSAPKQLSSEGERYPIEDKVLPLVFTLRQMNVCEPCWSCEGHLDRDYNLNKVPQVWFHTDSMILIRLLDECLGMFTAKKLLKYSWEIAVSYAERKSTANVFTIKPDLNLVERIELKHLQEDLKNIAKHVAEELLLRCKASLKAMQQRRTDFEKQEALKC